MNVCAFAMLDCESSRPSRPRACSGSTSWREELDQFAATSLTSERRRNPERSYQPNFSRRRPDRRSAFTAHGGDWSFFTRTGSAIRQANVVFLSPKVVVEDELTFALRAWFDDVFAPHML